MRPTSIALSVCAPLLFLLALGFGGSRASAQLFQFTSVDEEWTDLFDRLSGWTGADGIFSIRLDGRDDLWGTPRGPLTRTLFIFSDTAIGEVDPITGERLSGTRLVNNTAAILKGDSPDPDSIKFYWAKDGKGKPAPLFVPETPNAKPDEWYWLGDGIVISGKVHIIAYRMKVGNGGVFNFATAGVTLITMRIDDDEPWKSHTQTEMPLFIARTHRRGEVAFGAGIMSNTNLAGAPYPDGYVYVYGVQNDYTKKLLVARVLPGDFEDATKWRFWDGSTWVADIAKSLPVTSRVSNELSVTPLPDGRFVLAYQEDGIEPYVAIRVGDSPVGPFGPSFRVWECPEPDPVLQTFVYNAKAHPHLSEPGEFLISYNVNTFDFFGAFFTHADIYRPRFIKMSLTEMVEQIDVLTADEVSDQESDSAPE